MKILTSLSAGLIFCLPLYSQIVTTNMADEFKEVSKFGSHQSGFEGLQTYSSGIVNGSQFFSASWASGVVTTITGEKIGKGYSFIFDKVRQILFMKWKDSSFILLADKNQIKSFTLNTDKTHYFVPAAAYAPTKQGDFFEILVDGGTGYSLLKSVNTKFVKADPTDMEKVKSGDIYDSFVDEITYYISFNNGMAQPIALKERNIKKVLVPVKNKVDNYFAQHEESTMDESFLTELVASINN